MSDLGSDPVLAGAREARTISGLSGAKVFLLTRDGRQWFVRKAAREPGASSRLREQAAKQARFAAAGDGVLRAPRLLGDGEIEGRYFFDMEFVRGPDGASYLRSAAFPEVAAFAERLCAYLKLAAAGPAIGPTGGTGPFEALFAKVCEVARRTGALSADVLARLFLALDRLRVQAPAAATLCHGDLTLENLVVGEDGAVWAVDFLDAPFEHWWQDVAKLHQDLAGGWFLRRQPPVALGVTQFVSGRLLDSAAGIDPAYQGLHATLVACNFVRILPYVETPEERRFVLDRIVHFVERAT